MRKTVLLSLLMLGTMPPSFASSPEQDRALSALQDDVRANPRNTQALYMLALHYECNHDKAAALTTWRNYLAVEIDPGKRSIAEKHIHHLNQ